MKKILIPMTNHATLGETDEKNGTFSPEITHAIDVFQKAGLDYDLASVKGGEAPLYGTDAEDDEVNGRIIADAAFQNKVSDTIPASKVNIADYDAIFYPGGFGLLSDLALGSDFAPLSASHYESGGIISAVCHGPGALLPITLSNGDKLLASKSVTGFTREEEIDFDTIDKIPFLLEEKLARNSARYTKMQPWSEFIIEDERVITGQNPASAHAVATAVVAALSSL